MNKTHTYIEINIKRQNAFESYGRCINLSVGMIIGAIIDKTIICTVPKAWKLISFIIPPFSVTLATKGKLLKRIRFNRTFPKPIEYLLAHFIAKKN